MHNKLNRMLRTHHIYTEGNSNLSLGITIIDYGYEETTIEVTMEQQSQLTTITLRGKP